MNLMQVIPANFQQHGNKMKVYFVFILTSREILQDKHLKHLYRDSNTV